MRAKQVLPIYLTISTLLLTINGGKSFLLDQQLRQSLVHKFAALKSVDTDTDEGEGPISKRRKRTNKYAEFSKVNHDQDPLDILLAEAEEKNKSLHKEQQRQMDNARSSRRPKVEIAPLPKIEFPDNKDIDPYDPTTFGYVEVGHIIGAHGVRGWIKVKSTTDFPKERLCTAGIKHVKPPQKRAPRQVIVLQGRHRLDDEYLLQVEGVEDRDAALKLRGATMYVREEEKIEKQEDEYVVSDLVGLEVFLLQNDKTNQKQFVGTVAGVVFAEDVCLVPGLGHDYLELNIPRGLGGQVSLRDELVLIPLVKEIVPVVEIGKKEIFIDPPPGLLDLTYVRNDKTRIKGFLPSPEGS